MITAAKLPLSDQILINPLDRQAPLERHFDLLPPRLTQADRTRNAGRAGLRVRGWFCQVGSFRAGLRVRGWFWLRRHILRHRCPVQIQLPGDPPPRPSPLVQGYNALLLVHFELIHRPKCSKNRNTQANASPQKWLVLTRKSLAGFARKLTSSVFGIAVW